MLFGDYIRAKYNDVEDIKKLRAGYPYRLLVDKAFQSYKWDDVYDRLCIKEPEDLKRVVTAFTCNDIHLDEMDIPFLALRMLEQDNPYDKIDAYQVLIRSEEVVTLSAPFEIRKLVQGWAFPKLVELFCKCPKSNVNAASNTWPNCAWIVRKGYSEEVAVALSDFSENWEDDIRYLEGLLRPLRSMCSVDWYTLSQLSTKFYFKEDFLKVVTERKLDIIDVLNYIQQFSYVKNFGTLIDGEDVK